MQPVSFLKLAAIFGPMEITFVKVFGQSSAVRTVSFTILFPAGSL
jgi:hypothetical protein